MSPQGETIGSLTALALTDARSRTTAVREAQAVRNRRAQGRLELLYVALYGEKVAEPKKGAIFYVSRYIDTGSIESMLWPFFKARECQRNKIAAPSPVPSRRRMAS